MPNKELIVHLSGLSEQEWNKERSNHYNEIPPHDQKIRKKLFCEIYNIFEDLKINVWITGGTALGAIRDNNFIAWDDDIDMDMIEDDFILNMYSIKDYLIDNGFIVRLTSSNKYPKMVVFKYKMKVAIGSLKVSKGLLLRPAYKLPKHLFDSSKKISFMGMSVLIPYPPEDYLKYVYGRNWKTPKKVEDDVELYTSKYLRRPFFRIVLKRIYLKIKKMINQL
tara:strand:- start:3961 stop:4626 length:666 start_codon:yes stop_codon:yes gene_type:complete